MKKITSLIIFLFALLSSSSAQMYVEPKINVAAAAIAIFNPSVEIGFGKFSAIGLDYVGAYAKKNYLGSGEPFIVNMVIAEYRAYLLNNEHRGLFAGANFGTHAFKMSKNIIPLIASDHPPGWYDWGMGYLLGVNIGYKFLFNKKFGLEISVAGGWQHTQHESYNAQNELMAKMNASGEWLLYKGSVAFSYRFGCKK